MSEDEKQQHDTGAPGNSGDHRQDRQHRPEDHPKPEHPGKPIKPPAVHGGDDSLPRPPGGGPRLAASIQEMQARWPAFTFAQRENGGAWTGNIQPLRQPEMLAHILDDLEHDRVVYVLDGGEILHNDGCPATHQTPAWLSEVTEPFQRFSVEVTYRGGPDLPRAYVHDPLLPPNTPHVWLSDRAICAFNASERVWKWESDTVADYLRFVSLWLAKWVVWSATGNWIGAQHSGTPDEHLLFTLPNAPCWCGSGLPYAQCHRNHDMRTIAARP